jgi:hypothetical protein
MGIIAQFLIHAFCRARCVRLATEWESQFPLSHGNIENNRRLICLAEEKFPQTIPNEPHIRHLLLNSLLKAPVTSKHDDRPAILKLFQRAPFQPNYITNVVFLSSIFQPAVSTLVNHLGRPFHGAVLEHRQMIVGIGLSLLIPLVLITQGFPIVNGFLELRPWPIESSSVKNAQLSILGIFALNFVLSYLLAVVFGSKRAPTVAKTISDEKSDNQQIAETASYFNSTKIITAADREEQLLQEESEENGALVRILFCTVGIVFLSSMARTLEASSTRIDV